MLKDIRLKTLKLLDENMQSSGRHEYLDKMNSFIDMAQKQLAQIVPIRRARLMTAEGRRIAKPDDMLEALRVLSPDLGTTYPLLELGEGLMVPEDGEYLVEYAKYPATVDDQTADTTELELDPKAQEAIPYLAAALCVPLDEPQLYTFLLSQYNERLVNLYTSPRTSVRVKAGGGHAV